MYFSHITAAGALTAGHLKRDDYALHQAVWRLFADREDRTRDFLFRQKEEAEGLEVLIVSARPPVDPDGLWLMRTKPYAPVLEPGDRLRFSLRVNPVVKVKGENDKQLRHDVVMHAKKRAALEGNAKPETTAAIARRTGLDWLEQRADALGIAFNREAVRVDSYSKRVFRKKEGGKGLIELSTLDFNGACEVVDPERLTKALFQGVGPAKGFGCGLMLVQRV